MTVVVAIDEAGAVVGRDLVVLGPGLTVAAVLGDHEVDQDPQANGLAADLVANQDQEIDQNQGNDPGNTPEIDQDPDQGIDLEKGQEKGHVVVQVALLMVNEGNLVNHPPQQTDQVIRNKALVMISLRKLNKYKMRKNLSKKRRQSQLWKENKKTWTMKVREITHWDTTYI